PRREALIAGVIAGSDDQLVTVLANAQVRTSDTAMSQTIGKAGLLDEIIRTTGWELFDAIGKLTDERKTAAASIIACVGEVLIADEHAIAMKPAIDEARRKAL